VLKIRDPLGVIQRDPQLRNRAAFVERVVMPVCAILIAGPILFITVVVLVEVIKHG
jgi:hypothetical protein